MTVTIEDIERMDADELAELVLRQVGTSGPLNGWVTLAARRLAILHLEATHFTMENTEDKRRHGTIPVGEKAGGHKLTEDQVKEIRRRYGTLTLRELGKEYGVSHTAIRRAAKGIKWSYLEGAVV